MAPVDGSRSSGVVSNRDRLVDSHSDSVALDCLVAGIEAALPERVVEDCIGLESGRFEVSCPVGASETYDLEAFERVVLVGGGKAAGPLALELQDLLGAALDEGVVVTRRPDSDPHDPEEDGNGGSQVPGDSDTVEVVDGAHPRPGPRARDATERILDIADGCNEGTLVVVVVTGGGSALLPAPAGQLTLSDLQATTDALLTAGAPIDGINAVRKHCSAIKGGRLAARCSPATVVTVAISDVVGDDPSTIASGPTVPDDTTYSDALAVLDRHGVSVPPSVRAHLEAGAAGKRQETPGSEVADATGGYHLLATGRTAIEGARDAALAAGYEPVVLSASITGEAREVGRLFPAIVSEVAQRGEPVAPPAVVLSGGETTVTVSGEGRGGPNSECALAAAVGLESERVSFASVDTDGIDGTSGAAGGLVDGSTVEESAVARDALDRNDAATYLEDRNALVDTGETGTNVNDLRVLVIDGEDDRSR